MQVMRVTSITTYLFLQRILSRYLYVGTIVIVDIIIITTTRKKVVSIIIISSSDITTTTIVILILAVTDSTYKTPNKTGMAMTS